MMGVAYPHKKDLLVLKELLEMDKVVSVIDRTYSLAETAEAIRYRETGRARGKVIINTEWARETRKNSNDYQCFSFCPCNEAPKALGMAGWLNQ